MAAAGALLEYARATQGTAIAHVKALTVEYAGAYVRMDPATRRNLEISETIRGEPAPTLLSLLDTCATGMGSRWLRHALHHPLRDRAVLRARHGAVASLIASDLQPQVHALLKGCVDVERITARIALKSARPRDLSGLCDTLKRLPELARALATSPKRAALTSSRAALAAARRDRRRCSAARYSPSLRACCAKAASSPTASTPSSTSCARSRTTAASSCSISKRASARAAASPT